MKNIYYIYDEVGAIPVTSVILLENDALAMRGFKQFLEKAPAEKECYTMYLSGKISEDMEIYSTEHKIICTGKDVDEKYNDFIKKIIPED